MKKEQPNKFQRGFIKAFGIDLYLRQWEQNQKILDMKLFEKNKYEELENKVWFDARSDKLESFYKSILPFTAYSNQNKFWRTVNTQMPKLHYPLPSMISRSMGTLLFNQYPEIVVDAGSKQRNKELQKRLDSITDTNDILVLLQDAAAIQSYSGLVGFKLNFDPTISDDPLITIYPKEQIEIHKKYGQIIYIDFIDNLEGELKLISRYGLGYINYSLYNKDKKKIPLNSLPETAELKDIAFFDMEGIIIPVIFGGVIYNKGNKPESDYKGLIDTFHALDETYSSLMNYIRKTKPKTYLTEDLAPKDSSGKILPRSDFDDTIVVLDQVVGENASKIERDVVDLKIDGYLTALKELRNIALQKIGISPATLGIDAGGANQSGEALNIRERASGRLREEKLANWNEQLDTLMYSCLMFDYLLKNSNQVSDGIYYASTPHEFEVKTNFGEFVKETLEERSKTYMEMYEKKLISLDFALTQIFGKNLNEEQLEQLIIETKKQYNIPIEEVEE